MFNIRQFLLLLLLGSTQGLQAQWQSIPNSSHTYVRQIIPINGKLMVNDETGLATSTDGGLHWQRIPVDTPFARILASGSDLYGVHYTDSNQMGLYKSSDTGKTWTFLATMNMAEPSAMERVNDCIYFLSFSVGPSATVSVFNLITAQFNQPGYFSSDINRLVFDLKTCGNAAFLASDWGLIRYKNCGAVTDTFFPGERHTMVAARGDTIFSANNNADLLFSTDFGDHWTIIPHLSSWKVPRHLFFLNGEPWLVATEYPQYCDTRLWKLNPALSSGTPDLFLSGQCLEDLRVEADGHFVMASGVGVLTRDFADNVWFINHTGLGTTKVEFKAQDDFLLQAFNFSSDLGATWNSPVFGDNGHYALSTMVKKDGLYYAVVGGSGGLRRSPDLKNWESIAVDIPTITKAGPALLTTANPNVIRISPDGVHWSNSGQFPTQYLQYIDKWQADGDLIYMMFRPFGHSVLQRSADFGASWLDSGPGFPGDASDYATDYEASGPDVYALLFNQFQAVQKGIYASHDYGFSWKAIPAPSTGLIDHPMAVAGNTVWVTDGQAIWASANDGETWSEIDRDTFQGQIFKMDVGLGQLLVSTTDGQCWRRPLDGINLHQYSGTVFRDLNANGLREAQEPGLPHQIIRVSNRNWFAVTDSLGRYAISADLINDTIALVKPIVHCSILPPFVLSDANQLHHDFAVQLQPGVSDVDISAANTQVFRPGFETEVIVSVHNQGTVPVSSVQVLLADFADVLALQFLEADPPPSAVLGDSLVWDNLQPDVFGQQNIRLRFKVPANAPIGAPVHLPFQVRLAGDAALADNFFTLDASVVASLDPNDKRVQPDSVPPAELAGTDLRYTIRFQNTGNYPADFVTILDTLPADLNIASLRVLGASHPFTWRMRDGHVLEFQFKPIALPGSSSDEPGSHGFVQFLIRAQGGLSLGATIPNRAAIYFDYNPPVMTEYSNLHVAQPVVGTETPNREPTISIRPNPAGDMVWIEKDNEATGWLEVYNNAGKKVLEQKTSGKKVQVRLDGWAAGVFALIWQSDRKVYRGKLIKE